MALQTLRNPVRLVLIALLALGLAACSSTLGSSREGGGAEGPDEHTGSSEHGPGGESGEGGEGGENGEESATQYTRTQTYDEVRAGARLVLRYDPSTQTFTGTVTNTTNAALSRVRVEVHLSNGVELGPTKPMDLSPGQTIDVSLPATGQNFATWGAHPEVGSGGESSAESSGQHAGDSDSMAAFSPGFGDWAVIGDVPLGIESPGHGLKAWYTSQGGIWTPHLSPNAAPEHQPTGNATWTGEWAGYYGSSPAAVSTGAANVTVTLGTGTAEADLTLQGVPTLGTLQWDDMPVTNGRFMGSTTVNSGNYDAVGQFGGVNQAGVVGHATGSDFRSVFYGNKD